MLVLRSIQSQVRILCARELQNSVQDSVHQLLVDQIQSLGLAGAFEINESKIVSHIGSEFLFKGLRGMKNNAQQIKSLEGIDICWIEEGQTISAPSMQTITPTIRKPNSEIWITFNPDQPTDPVYQLVTNPPEGAIVRRVNWDSNPWFKDTSLPIEREWMLKTDPDAYAHVWEGECRQNSDAQVLKGKIEVRAFVPGDWDGPYQGIDWGFASDPTAMVRCWVDKQCLYIEHEAYGVGIEIDQLPVVFDNAIPNSRMYQTRADSARPETISYLNRHGYDRIVSVEKWAGSVQDGVAFLRSFDKIIIHPRCKHTQEESRLWSYKVDRLTGDILPELQDRHNHTWDAVRYALAPMIRRKDAGVAGLQVSTL
jgi:phage terminase large subunit